MAHNYDHAGQVASLGHIGIVPVAYTAGEGDEWRRAPLGERVHSIWFSSGDQWDEHNGWRGPAFRLPFDESRLGRQD